MVLIYIGFSGLILASLVIYKCSKSSVKTHKAFITDLNHIPKIVITDLRIMTQSSNDAQKITPEYIETLIQYYTIKLANVLIEDSRWSHLDNSLIDNSFENSKIYIDFTLNNDNFSIIVKEPLDLLNKTKCHILQRFVLSAEVRSTNLVIDVSDLLKKYQGPYHNFYGNLKGHSNNIRDILIDYDYVLPNNGSLIISDIFGQDHEFHLDDDIVWSSQYTLAENS